MSPTIVDRRCLEVFDQVFEEDTVSHTDVENAEW